MTPEERPFTPDEIDARVDQSSSVDAPPSSDQRLMQSLHALYSAEEQEMTNALERGRERLSQHLASLPTAQQRDGPISNVVPIFTEGRSARPSLQEGSLSARRWPLRLASLAAAVLLVILVGSLVAGLVLVRHNTAGIINKPGVTTQPSATTPSAPAQENLYLTTLFDESIIKIDTTARSVLWTYNWGTSQDEAVSFGGLRAGGGSVYFIAGSAPANSESISVSLYALDAADGLLRWKNTSFSNGVAALLAANGVVYVTDGTNLYALNASDGLTRWRVQVGDEVNGLVLAQGVLYGTTFGTPPGGQWTSTLFAVNAADGTLLWQSALPANKSFTIAAVVDGTIYLSSVEQKYPTGGEKSVHSDGKPKISYVYAYSLTGKQLWQSQQFEGFLSTPVIGDGAIYFTGVDAYALSAKDGSLLWDYPVDEGIIEYGGPFFANGTVYLESGPNGSGDSVDSFLIALDGQSGQVQWKQKLNVSVGTPGGSFTLANGFLYVVISGYSANNINTSIEALNADDGSLVWQTRVQGDVQPWLVAAP
jgi:outer membrane protein assembly factor BamB